MLGVMGTPDWTKEAPSEAERLPRNSAHRARTKEEHGGSGGAEAHRTAHPHSSFYAAGKRCSLPRPESNLPSLFLARFFQRA